MLKNKINKLFLVFGVILFSLFGNSCSNNKDNELKEEKVLNNIISNGFDAYWPIKPTLENKIRWVRSDILSLYKFKPNLENVKYIAGYADYYVEEHSPQFNIFDVKWYQYDEVSEIKKSRDDLRLYYQFVVIDGKFEYNFVEKCEMNMDVKYFYPFGDESPLEYLKCYEESAIWAASLSWIEKYKNRLDIDYYPIVYTSKMDVELLYEIINDSDKEYIKMKIGTMYPDYYSDYTTSEFGVFYEQLNSILLKDNENYEETSSGSMQYYGMIEISELVKIINDDSIE